MKNLNAFTQAYIECALWSSTDAKDRPLDRNYSTDDLAPETLKAMIEDCERFLEATDLPDYNHPQYSDAELAGHDFWLTRNRHGAGFWDRGLGAEGERLTELAHSFGEVDLYVGDDGKIYL